MIVHTLINHIQILSVVILSYPVTYWFISRFHSSKNLNVEKTQKMNQGSATIILPMRNEYSRLEDKILSVVDEIAAYSTIKLMVIDSDSSDNTYPHSIDVLKRSTLPKARWNVLKSTVAGKSVAINMALDATELIGDEVMIVMDTDIIMDVGWLETILDAFDDPEVAVTSGKERIDNNNTFFSVYKKNSNSIRSMDSYHGISTILEGGVMAIRIGLLTGFRLDERVNADDTQLALESMRRGHKSIILDSLKFKEGNLYKSRFKQGLRRSQGLSRVLIHNCDLVYKLKGFRSKLAFLNSLLIYTVVPWACFLSIGVSTAGLLGGAQIAERGWLDLFFLGSMAILPQGRALVWGSVISIISQIQYVVGINYSTWDPNTQ